MTLLVIINDLIDTPQINVIQFILFVAWLSIVCALHLIQCQVWNKERANYDNTMTLNKDSDLGVEVWLTAIWIKDGQDVSMGELNISEY